jgi:hypothetical protein
MILFFHHTLHLSVAASYPSHDFFTFQFLKGKDFIELSLQLLYECLFIIFIPGSPLGLGIAVRWLANVGCLEGILEVIVGDVVPVVVFD